jgi:transcriptional regulator with GAF, ATPase, and Fis domain
VIGVLYADHSSPAKALSESTINLFAAFCNLAAISIDNALAHQRVIREKTELEKYVHQAREEYPEIVGKSDSVEKLRDHIGLAALSPLDILITGESGTGKELVAKAIHRSGNQKGKKLITVDCGALSESLAEAELFGYRKGAFTGALENRQGLLEAAHNGMIFLDEVSNLPFRLQPKLLRVLQEREVRRIGETISRKIDFRVIAATNRDLLEEVKAGQFRKDLYYRLKQMEIRVPPLRERREDISLLIEWFLKKAEEEGTGCSRNLTLAALRLLRRYSYPGNIRELKNIILCSYYSTVSGSIGIDQLPPEVRGASIENDNRDLDGAARIYREILEGKGGFEDLVKKPFLQRQFNAAVVRDVIRRALQDSGGNYRRAFELLRIPEQSYALTLQFLKRNRCYLDFRSFRRGPT